MSVYENVRQIAKEQGISLTDLAIKSGLSHKAIYQWKNLNHPTAASLAAVAQTLNVSVDQLLGEESNSSFSRTVQNLDQDAVHRNIKKIMAFYKLDWADVLSEYTAESFEEHSFSLVELRFIARKLQVTPMYLASDHLEDDQIEEGHYHFPKNAKILERSPLDISTFSQDTYVDGKLLTDDEKNALVDYAKYLIYKRDNN
ncbi:helix-turn-helix transcriptional regulator [Weissella cibaria]|uniref:helix-turn-helix domain-containing protein n=1 Tax=Weissella cibaria TaxID=137591 RepID=UPI001190FF29|nr:helix-turn-helix transcriptional regulator [Weissella cibaria]TVV24857.1 helix-turn-helix transcriptional regulator [Weissella cibaria]